MMDNSQLYPFIHLIIVLLISCQEQFLQETEYKAARVQSKDLSASGDQSKDQLDNKPTIDEQKNSENNELSAESKAQIASPLPAPEGQQLNSEPSSVINSSTAVSYMFTEQFSLTKAPLDILFVVDSSSTAMGARQNKLATKLNLLLQFISYSNWHIAVNSTDPNQGCLRGFIKSTDPNTASGFDQLIRVGILGSEKEKGALQAINALTKCNDWLRQNSTLAVIMMSDADNCSEGDHHCDNEQETTGALYNLLNKMRAIGKTARVYGLINHPHSTCFVADSLSSHYARLIDDTSGKWGSVCSDYVTALQAISRDLAQIVETRFILNATPAPGQIKVVINGQEQKAGFKLEKNFIEFEQSLNQDALVEVHYNANVN